MRNQGLSLLEVLITLAILALASSLVILNFGNKQHGNDWQSISRFIEHSIQQSFYLQDQLRISCSGAHLRVQKYQYAVVATSPERSNTNGRWVDTDSQLKINKDICLYLSPLDDCKPCSSEPSSHGNGAKFQMFFTGGLALDSYQLRERAASIPEVENNNPGLLIHSHGQIEELP
ncbi:prepilin-type N-terminal cleavage/methylation domain-containing protein [uncultured Pseudoteredinibacter sp.]|uniref:pilus assembly FimT family protein n=1 Tax=uncultured Pseudoteredinibacter sp. TaxID=1641701 RepID=UPI002611891D|nr:prepilin-type N-terminal cleavage/methylation domain-containing protein [uncultured Pseudoteredinibacter sp.]